MGMYTEIILDVKLSKDIDDNLLNWLLMQTIDIDKYEDDDYYEKLEYYCPEHLKGTRVESINWFDNKNSMCIQDEYYTLHLEFEIKNYNNELQALVETLKPYIIDTGIIGTLLYEEYTFPGNIILDNNNLTFDIGSY